MTITQQQVDELNEGDIVEVTDDRWDGGSVRGPLRSGSHGGLRIGSMRPMNEWDDSPSRIFVRLEDGSPTRHAAHRTLTVIRKAPRPFYVNHEREAPIARDVAILVDRNLGTSAYVFTYDGREWWDHEGDQRTFQALEIPGSLILLVDGETLAPVTA